MLFVVDVLYYRLLGTGGRLCSCGNATFDSTCLYGHLKSLTLICYYIALIYLALEFDPRKSTIGLQKLSLTWANTRAHWRRIYRNLVINTTLFRTTQFSTSCHKLVFCFIFSFLYMYHVTFSI